jgi:hypothetical protein
VNGLAIRLISAQIRRMPLPPYALSAPTFRFRHLANLAGRAPIGGAREVALACFVAARLAADRLTSTTAESTSRAGRSAGAKAWLGTLALPAAVRTSLTRCADVSVDGTRNAVGREVSALATAASSYLDASSRAELEALAGSLKG